MRIVVEQECSRCARVDTREASKEDFEAESDAGETLVAILADGKDPLEIRFATLCQPCCRSIRAVLAQIGKQIDGLSPDRKPKELKKEAHAQANGHTPPVDHASAIKPAAAGVART